MNAPTYRLFPDLRVHRERVGRWVWQIHDGMFGPVIDSGQARTNAGARVAGADAMARCVRFVPPVLHPHTVLHELTEDEIAAICDELWSGWHIWVEAYADPERHELCVLPCCELTTEQEVRVLRAFGRETDAPLRWAGVR